VRGYAEDLWLVALHDTVADDEVRRWWNSKETTLLDELIEVAPRVHLGTVIVLAEGTAEDPEPSGPARRVFNMLFLRGTCPEDFDPCMDEAPIHELRMFLGRHEGARVLPVSFDASRDVEIDP
jgi:hypothetical protein